MICSECGIRAAWCECCKSCIELRGEQEDMESELLTIQAENARLRKSIRWATLRIECFFASTKSMSDDEGAVLYEIQQELVEAMKSRDGDE